MDRAVNLREYLEGLHESGTVDLDRPLRDYLSGEGLHIDYRDARGASAKMIFVWPSIFGDTSSVPLESVLPVLDSLQDAVEQMRSQLRQSLDEGDDAP